MKHVYFILIIGIYCSEIIAQSELNSERWKDYLEEKSAESEDGSSAEVLSDELALIIANPINLNRATAADLKRLPFLSDENIRNIISHRMKYGFMMSIYELKDVKDLDLPTIELLLPFIYVGQREDERFSFTLKNLATESRHEVQVRFDRCLQTKEGYREQTVDSLGNLSSNRRYLGEPFYHSLKYSYSFGNKIQAGMAAEKDAGEPFRKGYDFYSAHILLRNIKLLKTLALGDYRASFGQGLAMGYGGFPVQLLSMTDLERRNNGFARHGSTAEYGFFRGGAVAVNWNNISLSAFYSYRKLDATIVDSAATAIKTDGLHRLPSDLEKASKLNMQTLGGNLNFAAQRFSVGMTVVSNSFLNYPLLPPLKLYNIHNFSGHSNLNLSVDYRIVHHRFTFYGETAASSNKAIATLNALLYTPSGNIRFVVLHRYYDKAYHAFFSNGFSQSSNSQNEQGLYVAARFAPIKKLSISASVDRFAMPWPTYGLDAPSAGTEYALQVDYVDFAAASFYFRYRYRQKEMTLTPAGGLMQNVVDYGRRRLRMYARYGLQRFKLDFQTSVGAVFYDEGGDSSRGLMFSHRTDWAALGLPFFISLFAAFFDADGYNTSLSTYERQMPYAYGFNRVYGRGLRLAIVARWDIRPGSSLHVKAGDTHYADADFISSDLEGISGSRKTDIQILFRQVF